VHVVLAESHELCEERIDVRGLVYDDALTGLQPGMLVRHLVVMVSLTVARVIAFLADFPVPNYVAVFVAALASGSCCAPASAAASADAWSDLWVKYA
jgi:hypothetical protein